MKPLHTTPATAPQSILIRDMHSMHHDSHKLDCIFQGKIPERFLECVDNDCSACMFHFLVGMPGATLALVVFSVTITTFQHPDTLSRPHENLDKFVVKVIDTKNLLYMESDIMSGNLKVALQEAAKLINRLFAETHPPTAQTTIKGDD